VSREAKGVRETIRRQTFGVVLGGLLVALCFSAEAQQTNKVYHIGYLASLRGGLASTEDTLRDGLRDLGYIEGRNIVIESRSAEGKVDRLPGLAAELIGQKVDVIVVTSIQGALAAQKATRSIPIVFAVAQDPVRSGLVASLAKPGGNLTGVTDFARELAGKRLELLKETAPKISRAAILSWKPAGPDYTAEKNEIENAARALRVELLPVEIKSANEAASAISATIQAGANAFMGLTDTRFASNRKRIIELVVKNRLPAVYQDWVFVQDGGLMSYGTNRVQWRRRVASYVDRILKGAKPSELPIEQPTKFEFVINLKTAKQIGLTIPPNVLARADRVIR
jgi:putative tryptophan/tyrosine transport system substrate-binding protein